MKPQDNETLTVDATEKGYILKVKIGLVLPFKARDEDHAMEVAQSIARDFDNTMQQFEPKPEVVHIISGDVMTAEDWHKMKEHAERQADAIKQLLGMVKQAAADQGLEVHIPQLGEIEGETDKPAPANQEGSEGAVVDSIEPSPDAVRVPGSRTLN